MKSFLLLLCAFLLQTCHPVIAQTTDWKITKTIWTSQDEKNFSEFVVKIGEAVEKRQCRTVDQCLKSSANTYRHSDPEGLALKADCADFPYYLRAYFAWKNNLPFSLSINHKPRPVANNSSKDIRYSRYGNEVTERYDVLSQGNKHTNALKVLNEQVPWRTSTANFRTHYALDSEKLFTDFYPVEIDREAISAGAVLYDPNGHVAMVYKVTDDGRVYYVDAHPDNTLTTGSFGVKFIRSHPGQGAGFKRFRPLKLEGATQNSDGSYSGGRVVAAKNTQLKKYSVVQYLGENKVSDEAWKKAEWSFEGKSVSFYDYVRNKLALGDLKINPVDEFRNSLSDLCVSLKDRVLAVDIAIKAGIQKKTHPTRLPENIYGTHGEWETYSTPSRDAQLKVVYADLLVQAQKYLELWKKNDPDLFYSGSNLALDLANLYESESKSCVVSYTNSVGRGVELNLEEVRKRLFKLSFDPYHCVELRWGAMSADELSSCQDDKNKRLWYEREQRLRNQHIRQYDIRMDFSLEDLAKPLDGNGSSEPPDVDIMRFLKSQN